MSESPEEEIARLSPYKNSDRLIREFHVAAEALEEGRAADCLKIAKKMFKLIPESTYLHEILAGGHYELRHFGDAIKHYEFFIEKTQLTIHHPTLMDAYRTRKNWKKIDLLWAQLQATSPSAELISLGRVVYVNSLADRGQKDEALKIMRKKVKIVPKPKYFQLNEWYCLANLEEICGNRPTARRWFKTIIVQQPNFADVKKRLKDL